MASSNNNAEALLESLDLGIPLDDLDSSVNSNNNTTQPNADALASLINGSLGVDVNVEPHSTEDLIESYQEKQRIANAPKKPVVIDTNVPELQSSNCDSQVISDDNQNPIVGLSSFTTSENISTPQESNSEIESTNDLSVDDTDTNDSESVIISTDTTPTTQLQDDSLDIELSEAPTEFIPSEKPVDVTDQVTEDIITSDIPNSRINLNIPSSIDFGEDVSGKAQRGVSSDQPSDTVNISDNTSNLTEETTKPKRRRRKKKKNTEEVQSAIDTIQNMSTELDSANEQINDNINKMASTLTSIKKAKENVEEMQKKNKAVNGLNNLWDLISPEEKAELVKKEKDKEHKETKPEVESEETKPNQEDTIPAEEVTLDIDTNIDLNVNTDIVTEDVTENTEDVTENTAVEIDTPKDTKVESSIPSKEEIKSTIFGTSNDTKEYKPVDNKVKKEDTEENELDDLFSDILKNRAVEIWDEDVSSSECKDPMATFIEDYLADNDARVIENNGDNYYTILSGLIDHIKLDGNNYYEAESKELQDVDVTKFTDNITKLVINNKVYYMFKKIPGYLVSHRQKYLKTKLGMIKALTDESELADSVQLRIPKISKSTSLPVFTEDEIKSIKDVLREDFIITKETQDGIYAMYRTFL